MNGHQGSAPLTLPDKTGATVSSRLRAPAVEVREVRLGDERRLRRVDERDCAVVRGGGGRAVSLALMQVAFEEPGEVLEGWAVRRPVVARQNRSHRREFVQLEQHVGQA